MVERFGPTPERVVALREELQRWARAVEADTP
jgi:hypothetical protein